MDTTEHAETFAVPDSCRITLAERRGVVGQPILTCWIAPAREDDPTPRPRPLFLSLDVDGGFAPRQRSLLLEALRLGCSVNIAAPRVAGRGGDFAVAKFFTGLFEARRDRFLAGTAAGAEMTSG